MKKVLSILLAVLMIASTVAISGIVSASATAALEDCYYIFDPTAAKSASDMQTPMENVTSTLGVKTVAELGETGYAGKATDAYWASIATGTAKQGMVVDTPSIDLDAVRALGAAASNQPVSGYKLDMWVWANGAYTDGNLILRLLNSTAGVEKSSTLSHMESMVFQNSKGDGTAPEFAFSAGWNHIVTRLHTGSLTSGAIVGFAFEYHSAPSTAVEIAIADLRVIADGYVDPVVGAPEPENETEGVWVIDPATEKTAADVYTAATNDTTTTYSVVDVDDLGEGFGGEATTAYKASITGSGVNKQGMIVKTPDFDLPTHALQLRQELYDFDFWLWSSVDFTSLTGAPFVLRPLSLEKTSGTSNIEFHEFAVDSNGYSALKFNAGWNHIVVLTKKGGQEYNDIAAVAFEMHGTEKTAFDFAVSEMKIVPHTEVATKEAILVSPYGEKNIEDMWQGATSGASGHVDNVFEIRDNLTGGTANCPVESAYYQETKTTYSKDAMFIQVGGEKGVDVSFLMDEYHAKQTVLDAWIWVEDVNQLNEAVIFRLMPERQLQAYSYLEGEINNDNCAIKEFHNGWNHVQTKMDIMGNNTYAGYAYDRFLETGRIKGLSIYIHNKGGKFANYAVGAVKLSNMALDDRYDLNVEGSHYVVKNDTITKDDLTVTYKGVATDNYDLYVPATDTTGVKCAVITYANGEKFNFWFTVQERGVLVCTMKGYTGLTNGQESVTGIPVRNDDNILFDDYGMYAWSQSNVVTTFNFKNPIDFSGKDYIYINMLVSSELLNSTSDWNLSIEFGSRADYTSHCIRYNMKPGVFTAQGITKAGYNQIKIPIGDAVSTDNNVSWTNNYIVPGYGFQHIAKHSGITTSDNSGADFRKITFIRTHSSIPGTNIINGIGYGFKTSLNGEFYGDDLAATVAAAEDGDTVKVNVDMNIDETLVIDKDITLDINGRTLTSSANPVFKIDGGSLNVVDNNTYLKQSIALGATTKQFGVIKATAPGAMAFRVVGSTDTAATEYSTLNLCAGLNVYADYGVAVMGTQVTDRADYRCYGAKVVSAANFKDPGNCDEWGYDWCAFFVQGRIQHDGAIPEITINGGTFRETEVVDNGDVGYSLCFSGKCNVVINDGTFLADNTFGYGTGVTSANESLATLTVNGGTFYGTNVFGLAKTVPVKSVTVVNGGTFYNDDYKEFFSEADEVVLEDTDTATIKMSGSWEQVKFTAAGNKKVFRSNSSKSFSEFSFYGSYFEVNAYKGPAYGIFEVFIDGKSYGKVDCYATSEKAGLATVFGTTLEEGSHTVKLATVKEKNESATKSGIYYIGIDSIGVIGSLDGISTTLEDINVNTANKVTKIKITPVVSGAYGESALNVLNVEFGSAAVDGDYIVYTSGARAEDTITYTINGFTGTINVVLTAGAVVEFEDVIETGFYKTWALAKLSGGKALGFKAGASVDFDFFGSGIDLYGYCSKSYGTATVYVDGEEWGNINEYQASGCTYKANLASITGLEETNHEVTIVFLGQFALDSYSVK